MMRNKKRVAVLSCVIAAAVAAITACGGQPQGPAGSSGGESMSAETETAKAAVNVDDTLSFDDAVVTEFNVKLDGNDLKITEYEDCYVLNPTNIAMIPNEDGIGFMSVEDGVAKLLDQQAMEDFFYFVARNQTLKIACAFSNKGLSETGLASVSGFNEDSLYGTTEYPYSAYEFYSWNNDAVEGNGCGLDDTGLTWDEFMETEEGQALDLQLQMSSPIPYLVGDRESTIAPNWYVRHGFRDRDTAFALQAVLYRAIENNESVADSNCEFALLSGMSSLKC